MKKLIIVLAIIGVCFAQTKNIVPRAAHQGQIGTAAKPWKKAVVDSLVVSFYLTHDTTGLGNSSHWNTAYSWGNWAHTTLSGYGITDACASNDGRLSDARTPVAHNQAWSTIQTTPTTLSGYGITDADAAGSAATVQSNLGTHAALTGTAVHGLGTVVTHAATDFDASGAAAAITLSGLGGVPSSRKITSTIDLSADRNLSASDVGALATGGTAADVNVSGTNIAGALSGKLGTSATAADVNVSGTNIAAALSGKAATSHNQDASTINSGTLDGDRLPALSTTKKGGCPATGTPSGKYLKDDGTWATVSGGSTPTGTGWRHVTSGVEDGAATTPSASDVGLGNVTNESKSTMFTDPTFTTKITTPAITLNGTALTSTAAEINNLHGLTLSGSNTGDASGHGGLALNGAVTGTGITMSTAKLLGRTTAATGAIEEIAASTGLGFSAGNLTVSYGTASGTAAQGNDSRITGAEQTTNKGAVSGYCGLDASQKVAIANIPTASPTIVLGTAGALGSATSTIKSDATIAAFDATVVSPTTPGALGTTGSIAFAARRDHTHQSPGGLITNTSQVSVGPSVTTEVTILTFTLPANYLLAGTQIRFSMQGTHRSQATSGTLTIRMYVGATAGQTVILATQTNAVAASFMQFEGYGTVRTTGSSGTYIATGVYDITNAATTRICYAQGGASTTTVNTTTTAVVKLTAQWVTSSATNVLLIQNASIRVEKM